jgi:hypothetical protein
VSFDRDESATAQGRKLEFDMVSRPFVRGSDPRTNLPMAIDVGAFKAQVAIFDIETGRYIDQDVMLSSDRALPTMRQMSHKQAD